MLEKVILNKNEASTVKVKTTDVFKFEKYKYKVELLKWFITSVALVAIAMVIDYGFKKRAEGMQEILQYDKYVNELLVLNEDPGQKRMLAQFFSTVTPSETLRARWKEYFIEVDKEYQKSIAVIKVQDSVAKIEVIKLSKVANLNKEQEAKKKRLEASIAVYTKKLNPPIIVPNAGTQAGDYITAAYNESKGFSSLIDDRDVENAIISFEESNKVYNSFRQVYEIANYLKKVKSKLLDKNSPEWKVTYTTLVTKYSWGMLPSTKTSLLEASKKD